MRRHAPVSIVFVLLLALGCSRPAHPPGEVLYARYCASCHGAGGKGDGPVAASLSQPPPDLTTLARQAGGFDEARVMAIIDGRRAVAAHGPREMPVWGAVFDREVEGRAYAGYGVLLRAQVLSDYLRSLQD